MSKTIEDLAGELFEQGANVMFYNLDRKTETVDQAKYEAHKKEHVSRFIENLSQESLKWKQDAERLAEALELLVNWEMNVDRNKINYRDRLKNANESISAHKELGGKE